MRTSRTAWWLYVVGLVPLALFERPLRTALGNWWAFGAAITYLLVLRVAAEMIERRMDSKRKGPEGSSE